MPTLDQITKWQTEANYLHKRAGDALAKREMADVYERARQHAQIIRAAGERLIEEADALDNLAAPTEMMLLGVVVQDNEGVMG